jgi:predicted amidophosphoribosyltransferase
MSSLSSVEFASFLAYSVRGDEPAQRESRTWRSLLKNDAIVLAAKEPASRVFVRRLAARLHETPFADWFPSHAVLVPIPSSRLLRPGSLWVPFKLANAMVEHGLGRRVETWLERTVAIPKAAWAKPEDRASAQRQYETLRMKTPVMPSDEVVLVDDVITRGATSLGAVRRVQELLPGARIRGFAMVRAISAPEEFGQMFDPRVGRVELLPDGSTRRRP